MLKSKKDFDNLFLNKSSFYSSFYIVYYCKNDKDFPRFAISISKKNEKKAVNRNKIRRQIKSILRQFTNQNKNIDLIIIAKQNFLKKSFLDKKNDLEKIMNKIFNVK